MKVVNYLMLIALLGCSNAIVAMKALEKKQGVVEYKTNTYAFAMLEKHFDATLDTKSNSSLTEKELTALQTKVSDIQQRLAAIQKAPYFKGNEGDFGESAQDSWVTLNQIENLISDIKKQLQTKQPAQTPSETNPPEENLNKQPAPTTKTQNVVAAEQEKQKTQALPSESTEEQRKQAHLQEVEAQLEKDRQNHIQAIRAEAVKANTEELKRQEEHAKKEQYLEQEKESRLKRELGQILTSTIPSLRSHFNAIMKQNVDKQNESLSNLLYGTGQFLNTGGVFDLVSISSNPVCYQQVAENETYKALVKDIETARVNLILAKSDYKDLKSKCEAALKEKTHNYEQLNELKRLLLLLNEDLGKLRVKNKDLIQPYLDLARQIRELGR